MEGEPREQRFDADGVELAYFEWGEADAPVILLVHATGFHARCWDETVAALPQGFRVIAVDMRGHGRSAKQGPYVWTTFARDLRLLASGLDIRDAIGVGHSMGGHCVAQIAAERPETFRRLLLVDPVILDPDVYAEHRSADLAGPEDHPVARRRGRWASWQEMFERFKDRHPYSLWRPEVLEDYCRYGLLPAADGDGFELACPPLVEASIYVGSTGTDIYDLLPGIAVPVVVLRAPGREPDEAAIMDFAKSPTWPGLAARFPNGRDVYLPELTHFIPMQDPALTARFIVDQPAIH